MPSHEGARQFLVICLVLLPVAAACTRDPAAPAAAASQPRASVEAQLPTAQDQQGPWQEVFEAAAAGLVYTSEADYPFEYFQLFPSSRDPLTPGSFLALIGASPSTPIRERTLDQFFARHTTRVDPHDAVSVALIPRYEHLHFTLGEALDDRTTFCVGEVMLRCYVVGYEVGGSVVGVATWAVET